MMAGRFLMVVGVLGLAGAGWLIETSGAAASSPTAVSASDTQAKQILDLTGVRGGLVVHLGCGDGKLTTSLHLSDAYLVQGLDADPNNVEAARGYVRSRGLYGKVSIDRQTGDKLPYIENAVNLLVVEKSGSVPQDEMMRVLAPNGVLCLKNGSQWTKSVKPRPKQIDEWTHYLHDPSNNAVAQDEQVGPPRHVQWVADPNWSRHHDHMASLSAMVSANGRVFYIMDEGPRDAILLPAKWFLVARDAFSGMLLWKRSIDEWNTHLWPLKSGPNQLPRRIVAQGDRVYVTLGIDAPTVALDAATGETLQTYQGTEHTDEILNADGVLYFLVAHSPNKWKHYSPIFTYVWSNTNRANKDWAWDEESRSIVAVKADNGAVLWKSENKVAPLTMGLDDARVYFYDGEKVVALNRHTGKQAWASEPVPRSAPFPTGPGPTLVVQQGVVLLSIERKSMQAFSAADGKLLWKAPHHPGGHQSPDDMLVVNGLVWCAAIANGADSGVMTGRDLQTGEVKVEFLPDVHPDWFHHRCYRSRATPKYFIASRTGIEYIDLAAKKWDINHWVRGGCLYGFMPCNGLTYVPPQACGCFLESKLFGFNALAPESPSRQVPRDSPDANRLETGPAYEGEIRNPKSEIRNSDDWPTYRHDAQRSGSTKATVPSELKHTWEAKLGGRLSSVSVAGGKAFVAAIDEHTLYAMDADSGKPAWQYTTGGRIDSPPTVTEGRAVFGSADGWVYCLRSDNGQLIWRFRAAPIDRRLVAREQVESAWPVSGSVLLKDGAVYGVAGRSAFLDGGMRLVKLDLKTGKKLAETILDERDPETGKNLQSKIKGQDMPVALPDVLSCDDRSIYMRTQGFDFNCKQREVAPIKLEPAARRGGAEGENDPNVQSHIFSRSGLLDSSWYFRSYWMFGKAIQSNYGGWLQPGHYVPSGGMLVFDDADVYGFSRKPEFLCNASVQEYYLFSANREVKPEAAQHVRASVNDINAASQEKNASSSDWALRQKFSIADQSASTYHWAAGNTPLHVRAMAMAGKTLFVAGPPDVLDEEEAFRNLDKPGIQERIKAQAEAMAGRKGGLLLAVSIKDGTKTASYELGAIPTFDGMAAARGKLYLTTADGRLICLGSEGAPLAKAQTPKLVPLKTNVRVATGNAPQPTAKGAKKGSAKGAGKAKSD